MTLNNPRSVIPCLLACLMTALSLALSSCCSPPPQNFMSQPKVQQKIEYVQTYIINMLPPEQRVKQDAKDEAKWLIVTAYEQSGFLAQRNGPVFFGWINNNLVNTGILDRGLCWHYQHDMYRELRRRPLKYFYLGVTVRDRGKSTEHSCVYINAKGKRLPDSVVLDAWVNCGHLKILYPKDRKLNWEEAPDWQYELERSFPEGHKMSNTAHLEPVDKDGYKYTILRDH